MHPLFQVQRKAQGGPVEEVSISQDDNDLKMAAHELMRAISSGKSEDVAKAFKAMFMICESKPHEEYEDAADQE